MNVTPPLEHRSATRSLSFRVWFQSSCALLGIGAVIAAAFVLATGRIGTSLILGALGLLMYGFATNPLACPNCRHSFPFRPAKPWATSLPAICPACGQPLPVAGLRPPLSIGTRAIVFVLLAGLLLGSGILADSFPSKPGLTLVLKTFAGTVSVAQYFFIRIFLLGR